MSEIKIGVILNYVSICVRILTTFILTPLSIRSLGETEYAIFMLANSFITWFSLCDLGLSPTITKYIVKYRTQDNKQAVCTFISQLLNLFLLISLVIVFIGVVIFFFVSDFFPAIPRENIGTLKSLYLVTLLNFVLSFPLRPIVSVSDSYQKFIVPLSLKLASSVFYSICAYFLLNNGFKSLYLITISSILSILTLILIVFYVSYKLRIKVKICRPDLKLYKELLACSFWLFLVQIMDLLYWRAGAAILANTSTVEQVNIYNVGVCFSSYFIVAAYATTSTLAPSFLAISSKSYYPEQTLKLFIKTSRIQMFLLIQLFLLFIFAGEPFLKLWIGDSLSSSINSIWVGTSIVMFAQLVPLIQTPGSSILLAINQHRGRAIILFISAIFCFILGCCASRVGGALGMFLSIAISLILGQTIALNIFYYKVAKLNMYKYFKQTIFKLTLPLLFILPTGYGISKLILVDSYLDLFVSIVAFIIFSSISLYFAYLSREERNAIISLIKK